jgi:calcium-dependent protein kinase
LYKSGKLTDTYDKVKELGKGTYGLVYRVKNKITGEERACKQLLKSKIQNSEKFKEEINIMSKADHPNIIKLYEIYEDNRNLYLIMEECKGGELFDRIINKIEAGKMYSEKEAANIFKQVMYAISYCHNQKICHRDIKAENILFLRAGDDSPIKVIDFGLSKIFFEKGKEKKMTLKVGTAYYVSPEVLNGNYDEKCDIWSCGVLLYILLSGNPPFNGQTDQDIYEEIEKRKFDFPDAEWANISSDAKDLISKMLCDPDKRLTAQQVLCHPWIKKEAPNSQGMISMKNIESMRKFKDNNKLQKAVITFIASRLQDKEVEKLKNIFQTLDANSDGTLTLEEMKNGIESLKDPEVEKEIETLFNSLDTDKSGKIDYTEFLAACLDKKNYLRTERLTEAFQMLDLDKSGKISKQELKDALKFDQVEDSVFEKYIEQYDLNKDGEIDYNEFLNLMGALSLDNK